MDEAAIKKSALIVATASAFITPFMGSSINIALPSIQRDLQIDAVLLSWIATAYLLAAAVCLVPFGRLADIHGRKKVYTYGIMIFTVASLLSGISVSVTMLILARIVQGIGSAMIFGTGMAILMSVYPPGERGKVLGITVAAVYLGLSLGPFCGGFLTQHLTWRSVFLVNVPLGLSLIPLIFWKLKGEWAGAKGEKFDLVGSVIYGVSVIAIMYGMTLLPELKSAWLLAIGLSGVVAFIICEMRTAHPVFEVRLFKSNRAFALSNLAALINYSATFAVTFLVSLYLQYIKDLTPQNAGLILVAQPIMMALVSPLAGRLSDRIEPRVVASLGMMVTTIALVLFALVDNDTPLVFIVGRLVILGFGLALFSSPNTNAIMSSVEKRYFGIASGAVGTMRLFGQMMSMGIATLIFALLIGRVQITPEYYPVFMKCVHVAFAVFAALCFAGVFASLARGRILAD
jgi:EmrB/QacA subfamily drug resistance transporter